MNPTSKEDDYVSTWSGDRNLIDNFWDTNGCHRRRAFYSEVRKYAFFMHFLHDDKSASLTNEYFVV